MSVSTHEARRRARSDGNDCENVDPQPASPPGKAAALNSSAASNNSVSVNVSAADVSGASSSPFQEEICRYVHRIHDEHELRALTGDGGAAAVAASWKNVEGKSTEWLAVFVHAPWAWPNFCPRRGLLADCKAPGEPILPSASASAAAASEPAPFSWPWIVKQSRVPLACVSVADIPDVATILDIRANGLPVLCMLRRRRSGAKQDAGYETVVSKAVKNGVEIASQTLLEPIADKAELAAALRGLPSDKIVVGYVGAAWCPPCCRVIPALPALQAAYAAQMRLVKMDYDIANALVTQHLGIEKIPTFVAFRADAEGLLPFGALQNSDAVLVNDQMRKWCDLVAAANQSELTFDDDF